MEIPPVLPARPVASVRKVAARTGSSSGEETQQQQQAQASLQSGEREAQQRARDFAYRKILDLRERIRALKLIRDVNPKGLAGAVAQIAKELLAAVKEYREAGGKNAGGLASTGAAPAPAAPAAEATPEAQHGIDAYRTSQMRAHAEQIEGEAIQDGAVVRDARDMAKTLREFLRDGFRGRKPDRDERKHAKDALRDLRDTGKLLDGLQGIANAEALEAKLTGKLLKLEA